jgi:sirohydrochlorin ferrochelatase
VKTALLLAVCLAGCSAYQNVAIESDPPGAEIFLDGKPVGPTPQNLRVSRDLDHTVYLKKDGYRPELVVLEKHEANDGIDFLTPADVARRLSPGPSSDPELERRLKIEVEEQPAK